MTRRKKRRLWSSAYDGGKRSVIRFHSGDKNILLYKCILRFRHLGFSPRNPRQTPWADIFRPFRPFAVIFLEAWHYCRNGPHLDTTGDTVVAVMDEPEYTMFKRFQTQNSTDNDAGARLLATFFE